MTPSQALADVLVDELARCGVRHVVLCPGSRSAPLAYALLAADRAGRLRLHIRVDERSAAFLALGLSRGGGTPAAVVTTSGTAVANLHPAVLEAHEAGVPLLLLTADRPPELRGTRANQTTHQVGIFGAATRWSHDLGAPERRAGQQASWRTAVDRAVAAATGSLGGEPGPAHLNVPLRDPLAPDVPNDVPNAPDAESDPWPEALTGRPDAAPWTAPLVSTDSQSAGSFELPDGAARTLVVLGDLRDLGEPGGRSEAVLRAARRRGWPVIAEPFGTGSREGVVPHGPVLLDVLLDGPGALEGLHPERILLVGRLTLSRATARLLRTPGVRVEAVTDGPRWPDPGHVLHAVHPWRAAPEPRDEAPRDKAPRDDAWYASWQRTGSALHDAVAAHLSTDWAHGRPGRPGGAGLAHALLGALPADACLFVGSSNSARDVETARGPAGPAVVANRGLAGIDGCVSTASGLALARPGAPTYALVGDLTFLHDANALAVGPGEPRPNLTVVVADDAGGGIFATLEYGEPRRRERDPDGFERLFTTPTRVDLAALCRAHGVGYALAEDADTLREQVGERPDGLRVVHVPIRVTHRADREALRAVAADALQRR